MQSISLSRLLGALVFASLAFQNVPLWLVAAIYILAMCSDLLDGFLARRLAAISYFGKVLDLVSDKSLTIVSFTLCRRSGSECITSLFDRSPRNNNDWRSNYYR